MSLSLAGVAYRYAGAGARALAGIDLTLDPGEVLGVVGANGSGKSTLCLVAAGLAPAVIGGRLEGEVLIDGERSTSMPPHQLAQRCAIVFQNPATQLSGTAGTVWEEVAFGPHNLGVELREVVERVDAALHLLRIADLASRDPSHLSGGQAQLVALASVLAMRPAYLVLDEPTSELDPDGTRQTGAALTGLAASAGVGIILVEHKADLLQRLASRVAVLVDGSVATSGPAAEVLADPRLSGWGISPPSDVGIARALSGAGLHLPSGDSLGPGADIE